MLRNLRADTYTRTNTHMHENFTPSVQDLSARAEQAGLSVKARERLSWITHFLGNDHSITDTCAAFDISRSTFCRWLDRFDPNDLMSLEERSHEPLTIRQSAVSAETVAQIRAYRTASPLLGKERISELLLAEHGAHVSPSTVGRIIDRECLYFADTPLHWKKRMRLAAGHAEHVGPFAAPAQVLADAGRDASIGWTAFKRGVLVASLVTNVAVIAMMAFSALWETKVAGDQLSASVSSQEALLSPVSPRE